MADHRVRTFETRAQEGHGDAGVLAEGLRREITDKGLWGLAAVAVHAAAAAPEHLIDVYEAAAAGWLRGEVFPSRPATTEPLAISPAWWRTFWSIVNPPAWAGHHRYAQQMMALAGELDLGINPRMAAVALMFPGIAQAVARGLPDPPDLEWLSQFPPGSLGYALSEDLLRPGNSAANPYWTGVVPLLRHMPSPLNFINIHVIHSMPLWALVGDYSSRTLDRVAMGGFLMAQTGHHYSALVSAVTLVTIAEKRPDNTALVLDSLLRGWVHGRETPPLVQVAWEPVLPLDVDQARRRLRIDVFQSPHRSGDTPRPGWLRASCDAPARCRLARCGGSGEPMKGGGHRQGPKPNAQSRHQFGR